METYYISRIEDLPSPIAVSHSSPSSIKLVSFGWEPSSLDLQVAAEWPLPLKENHYGAGGFTQPPRTS